MGVSEEQRFAAYDRALDRSTSAARMESRGTARSKKWLFAFIDKSRETAISIKL